MAKRDELMQELNQVEQNIVETKNQINEYSAAIQENKTKLSNSIKFARQQHRLINEVFGSGEEDPQLIADVERIRLRAIETIEGPCKEQLIFF